MTENETQSNQAEQAPSSVPAIIPPVKQSAPESLSDIMARKSVEEAQAGIPPAPVRVVEKQVNAPGRIYPGLPKVDMDSRDITLEEINIEIDSMNSAASADPQGHPLLNKRHALSKSYRNHRSDLYDLKAKLEEYEPKPDLIDEYEEKRAQKEGREQARRVQLAEIEMKNLAKLGFTKAEIPGDISEIQYQLLRAETQYAKEKYLEGDAITMDVARQLKVSSSTMQAHYNLRNVSESAEAKRTVANQITFFLNAEHKKQQEALEELKAEIQTKAENRKDRFRYL